VAAAKKRGSDTQQSDVEVRNVADTHNETTTSTEINANMGKREGAEGVNYSGKKIKERAVKKRAETGSGKGGERQYWGGKETRKGGDVTNQKKQGNRRHKGGQRAVTRTRQFRKTVPNHGVTQMLWGGGRGPSKNRSKKLGRQEHKKKIK